MLVTFFQISVFSVMFRDHAAVSIDLDTVLLLCMSFIPPDTTIPFKFIIRQFPLCLTISMTIKELQGQTFDKICYYLLKPVSSHGQIHVALSTVQLLGSLSAVSEMNETFTFIVNQINKLNGFTFN
jgi:hypothetical protein